MFSGFVAEPPLPSATRTVKFELPAFWGVPVIAPDAASESPAGNEPPATVQLYEPEPPDAASVCAYATPATPSGNPFVVIVNVDGAILRLSDLVADEPAVSLTRTLKFEVPAVWGVPVITPVDVSVRP